MMGTWAFLLLPTLALWAQSILWVATMSLYANFVGHFASMDASRAERALREQFDSLDEKLERLLERSEAT